MKALESPLSNGDMYPPPPDPYSNWGVVGRAAWVLRRKFTGGDRYLGSLKRQITERGTISPDVWGTDRRRRIAEQLHRILYTACWRENLSFHPSDPWMIVGKCEVGNMSELDAVLRIEKAFKVNLLAKDFWGRVQNGLTFGNLVTYLDENEGESAS